MTGRRPPSAWSTVSAEHATYLYADEGMSEWMEEIHNEERDCRATSTMIGDNPKSDIVGGNMYGVEYLSCQDRRL
jgi:ribonucleotide monophosphatase NagD (HAD superfamily)